ncbi:AraC family transcriptional regulator [Sneathiella chinensis]|uniref:AraC family transcriptional regulator n=1 Tax=Sneathiella chinensis TaxID=349750 RepID=A0ABQ5U658_9PROT|nr:helix-turn-helix transcriptional regulator [Sneathiella chinensis]GLQ06708.1 AraC family transcriptional regulator [Sneathiella chinensis]
MNENQLPIKYDLSDFLHRPIALKVYDLVEEREIIPHRHEWGQLVYTVRGVVLASTDEGRWLVPPERVLWIPANTDHGIYSNRDVKFLVIHVAAEKCARMPSTCRVLQVNPLLKELIASAENIPRDYTPDTPESRLMEVMFDQVCIARSAPLLLPMPSDQRLRKITNIFMNNPADPRTLAALAQDIGLSERNLARLFKRETGLTFGKWRQQHRLMVAVELLASGQSVTSVALEMGYDSISAFISMFKQMMGVTPSKYFINEN